MAKVSVIIPSHYDWFFHETIREVLKKGTDIEVIAIQDGWRSDKSFPGDHRLKVVQRDSWDGVRASLNQGVDIATGKYVMKLDAHCAIGQDFDRILQEDMEDNWIVTLRRYALDVRAWEPTSDSVDFEYYLHPYTYSKNHSRLGLYTWPDFKRSQERKDILIDEDMAYGGSCFFMTKEHYVKRLGYLSEDGYGTFMCDNVETGLKTQLGPWQGKLMRNKKSWYAHLRKIGDYKKNYYVSVEERIRGNRYAFDYWWFDKWDKRVHDFEWLIDRFWPLPDWPSDWKEWKDGNRSD